MLGVSTSPPKVEDQPKPTSSSTMYKMFGAPLGGVGGIGNAGSDTSHVRPTRPGKGSPSRYVLGGGGLALGAGFAACPLPEPCCPLPEPLLVFDMRLDPPIAGLR